MKNSLSRIIGLLCTLAFVGIFILNPSWPTPDKLLVLMTFVFMIFGQAQAMLKRFVPFVALLLVYESFRSIVPHLNGRVEYTWMIKADEFLFGTLPTQTLQNWFWNGHVQWYDFAFYLLYMLHFILPIGLAIIIWKYREKFYWQYITTFLTVSLLGFFTFLAFPAAPPWLASQQGYIKPIERVSTKVFEALGIVDFPSLYSKISPNPVAAVPSLHAAYATLLVIFIYKLFGKKKAALASLYPLTIYVGTIYSGEHYAIDELLGIVYAAAAYFIVWWLFARIHLHKKLHAAWQSCIVRLQSIYQK